ncbi:HYR domain-containing protein [Winogradskyella sp. 3972H.M.0a.05]|uniref:HYR domain-containing protein n=1 Tax=Winogradskyella sp. 3972H.M.0a.05 TaxID=2950277 RepID=UPI0033998BB5
MKKKSFFLASLFLLVFLFSSSLSAQNSGIFDSFIIFDQDNTGNQYYDLQSSTGNPDFDNAYFGNLTCSNSLVLNGGQNKTFKCPPDDIFDGILAYRVYETGTTPGAFIDINLPFLSENDIPCGGKDQVWEQAGAGVDILAGLSSGNYTIEVFSRANFNFGTHFSSNFGANFKATFDYTDNAPTAVCQDITVQLDANGMATINAADVDGGSSDDCGSVILSVDINTFDCDDVSTGGGGPTISELFISEYIEGSSNNKCIEIYNGTGSSVDLSGYSLERYSNGGTSGTVIALSGTVADGDVFVICNPSSAAGFLAEADATSSNINFNGDDAVALFNGSTAIDVFGKIGEDPGTDWSVGGNDTSNQTLIRNADILSGNTDDAAGFPSLGTEWTELSQDDVSNLGSHTVNSGSGSSGVPVMLTVTDTNGNSSTCNAKVTVEDNLAPTAVCQDMTVQLDANGQATITAADVDGGSTDNCGSVELSINKDSFDCSHIGPNTVTLTVTDASGNTSTCDATVTVEDNEDPNAVCQDIEVQLDANGQATITAADVDGGSTDNCGSVTLSIDQDTFDCDDVSTGGGATISELFISEYIEGSSNNKCIEIYNGTGSSVDLSGYSLERYSNGGTSGTVIALSGTVADGDVFVICNPSSAAGFLAEADATSSNINFNGDDAVALFNGSTAIDVFGKIGEDPGTDWSVGGNDTSNQTLIRNADILSGNTDDAAGFPSLGTEWTELSQDDVSNLGSHTVNSGSGSSGVDVTLTVTDTSGNSSTCTATVTVIDTIDPTAVCQDITVQLDGSGQATITAADVDGGSTDNCGSVELSINNDSFDCTNIGPNTVTLTATDASGNTSTCDATVTVEDNIAPIALCQDLIVELDATGTGTITASDVDNGSNDLCGDVTLSIDIDTFTCDDISEGVTPADQVWINEFHYDNDGSDTGEFVEVAGTAGVDLTGYSVVLYNGSNGTSYGTINLSGILPNESNGFGAASFSESGIQNGAPDGLALVDPSNTVIEFLSYEGSFAATNGPANGLTSTDIGIFEAGNTDIGDSVQLTGSGSESADFTWSGPSAESPGSLNVGQTLEGSGSGSQVTLTVTDESGNTATCTANITVIDTAAPTALCQDIEVQLDENGQATITASDVDGGSNDACGDVTLSIDRDSFSCADISSGETPEDQVWINELHYDNDGGDTGEFIEVAGTAGVDLSGYSLILYNGSGGAAYNTIALSGVIDDESNGFGAVDFQLAANGVQNGSPDGVALAGPGGLIEFLSYEGSFTASGGAADGVTSTDIGVAETASTPIGESVQLKGTGSESANFSWTAPSAESPGDLNDGQTLNAVGSGTQVVLTVTDESGNTATCTANVTVVDTAAPIALCQDIEVVLDENGQASITAADVDNGSSDACSNVTLSIDQDTFDCTDTTAETILEINELFISEYIEGSSNNKCIEIYNGTGADVDLASEAYSIFVSRNGGSSTSTINLSGTLADGDVYVICNPSAGSDFLAEADDTSGNINFNGDDALVLQRNGNAIDIFGKVGEDPGALWSAGGNNTQNQTLVRAENVIAGNTDDASGFPSLATEWVQSDVDTVSSLGVHSVTTTLTGVEVTLTVTDEAGNSATCTAFVSVKDETAPTVTCPEDAELESDPGLCGAVFTFDVPFDDNCDGATIEQTEGLPSGSLFPIGETEVVFVATDASGNTTECAFSVIVEDTEDPTVACPADTAIDNDPGSCGAVFTYDVPFDDNCEGTSISQTAGLPSGAMFPLGDTINTFEVTDAAGNTSSCSFTVTVNDTEDPTLTCPVDVTLNNDTGNCSAIVIYTVPFADNCPGVTLEQTAGLPSGDPFPIGTTTNTFVATDASGNTTECSFTVTVIDTEMPVLNCPEDIELTNAGGSCDAIVEYEVQTSDNCPGSVVTQLEGLPSGSSFPVGETVNTFMVTDASGNSQTCSFLVTVTDEEKPELECPADITVNNDPGNCSAIVNYAIVASDNCPGDVLTQTAGLPSGAAFPIGETLVSYTLTDAAGLTAHCSFIVTVIDSELPQITCPGDISVGTDDALCGAVVDFDIIASDNCPDFEVIQHTGLPSGSEFPVGETYIIFEVLDASGNSVMCDFFVTVEDTDAPEITGCPEDVSLCGAQTVDWTPPTVTDSCPTTVTSSHNPGDFFDVGTTTVVYTATDDSGNTSECSFDVTIYGEPQIEIVESALDDFCQGLAELTVVISNESDLDEPVTINWSTGSTEDSIIVTHNDTFTVTVSTATGCEAEASYTTNIDATDVLSGYTMIGKRGVNLYGTYVSGGVGVLDPNKLAFIGAFSYINGFVKSDYIWGTWWSYVANPIYDNADVTLPTFYENNADDDCGNNVTVHPYQTVTITGEIYDNIKVKYGGTLIIDSPEVYIDKLSTESNAKIEFNQPSAVMIDETMKIGRNNTIASNGNNSVFYVEKDVRISARADVNVNIYTKRNLIVRASSWWKHTRMKGLFIALDEVYSSWNVKWLPGKTCGSIPTPDGPPAGCEDNDDDDYAWNWGWDDDDKAANPASLEVTKDDVKLYPVPTRHTLNVDFTSPIATDVAYSIVSIKGDMPIRNKWTVSEGKNTTKVDVSRLAEGQYYLIFEYGDQSISKQFIIVSGR